VHLRTTFIAGCHQRLPRALVMAVIGLNLLDIGADVVSSCLDKLTAHTQGPAICTCKLFAAIISEVRLETTYLRSAITADMNKALVLLAPKLFSPPSVGVMFTTRMLAGAAGNQDRNTAVKNLVRSLPPALHLVGGEVQTLVGTCPDGSLSVCNNAGVALTLGDFPEAEVSSFVVTSQGDTRDQLAEQGVLAEGWKVIVVLTTVRCGQLLQILQTTHPQAAIIGGVVTGSWMVRAHAHRVQFIKGGVVGLMFRGNVPLAALVCAENNPTERLKKAKREVEEQGKTVLGSFMFTCCARSEERDAKAFTTVFPNTPLTGMPCGGEIGPDASESKRAGPVTQVGNVQLQGFTAVYGLFAHPIKTRDAPLYIFDVEEAYRRSRGLRASVKAAAVVEQLKHLPEGPREILIEDEDGVDVGCCHADDFSDEGESYEEESDSGESERAL